MTKFNLFHIVSYITPYIHSKVMKLSRNSELTITYAETSLNLIVNNICIPIIDYKDFDAYIKYLIKRICASNFYVHKLLKFTNNTFKIQKRHIQLLITKKLLTFLFKITWYVWNQYVWEGVKKKPQIKSS